jgi:hypothetical protein
MHVHDVLAPAAGETDASLVEEVAGEEEDEIHRAQSDTTLPGGGSKAQRRKGSEWCSRGPLSLCPSEPLSLSITPP